MFYFRIIILNIFNIIFNKCKVRNDFSETLVLEEIDLGALQQRAQQQQQQQINGNMQFANAQTNLAQQSAPPRFLSHQSAPRMANPQVNMHNQPLRLPQKMNSGEFSFFLSFEF